MAKSGNLVPVELCSHCQAELALVDADTGDRWSTFYVNVWGARLCQDCLTMAGFDLESFGVTALHMRTGALFCNYREN